LDLNNEGFESIGFDIPLYASLLYLYILISIWCVWCADFRCSSYF